MSDNEQSGRQGLSAAQAIEAPLREIELLNNNVSYVRRLRDLAAKSHVTLGLDNVIRDCADEIEVQTALKLELLADGEFLADRIAELEGSLSEGDAACDYYGHVLPALARFRAAIAKAERQS